MKALGFFLFQQSPEGFVKTISMKLHREASAEFSITSSSSTKQSGAIIIQSYSLI